MGRPTKNINGKRQCTKCLEWKSLKEFRKQKRKYKDGVKEYLRSECKKCESLRLNRLDKETGNKKKIKYKQSYKGLVRQVIDDILYKRGGELAKKFRYTKERLIELNERDPYKYKQEFLKNVWGINEKIWSWLYEFDKLPELEVIEFLLNNKKKMRINKKEFIDFLEKLSKLLDKKSSISIIEVIQELGYGGAKTIGFMKEMDRLNLRKKINKSNVLVRLEDLYNYIKENEKKDRN